MIRVTGRKPQTGRGVYFREAASVNFKTLEEGAEVFSVNLLTDVKATVQKVIINRTFDQWTRRHNRHCFYGIQIKKLKDRKRNTEKIIAFYFPNTRRPFAIYIPRTGATVTSERNPSGQFYEYLRLTPEFQNAKAARTISNAERADQTTRFIMRGAELKELPAGTERAKVTYGSDPEFELLDSDTLTPLCAADIPDFFRPRNWTTAPIGIDREGNQIELRPAAADTPEELADKIKELLKTCPYPLGFTGNRYACGCHIHVGIGRDYTPPEDLLNLFHLFLGRPAKVLNGLARRDYARLDYRPLEEKPHGFEYRSAPAAIIQTPRFFALCARIIGRLTESYISGDVIEVNDTPEFEDYFNFCGFSLDDYKYFYEHLTPITAATPNFDTARLWLSEEELAERDGTAAAIKQQEAERRAQRLEELRITQEEHNRRQAENARELERRRAERAERAERQLRLNESTANERTQLGDTWQPAAASIVAEVFAGIGESLERAGLTVSLFGLDISRGDVTYRYNAPDFDELPAETFANRDANYLGFGLAYRLRQCEDAENANALREHLTIIREQIERRF